MRFPPALLERWMRRFYFTTELDLGSSGVEPYGLGELRARLALTAEDLDSVVFDDAPTAGGQALRRAIAMRWAAGQDRRVLATHGSSEALFLVLSALVSVGDEVVTVEPCYPQLAAMAESLGASLVRWKLLPEDGFKPDLAEVQRLVSPRTRLVIANFPHNPTGATLAVPEIEQLVAAAEKEGAYLLWDAAFSELVYDGEVPSCPPLSSDRVIVIGTLSKSYGLPGLRLGWVIAPESLIDDLIHRRDYLTLHLSPLTELIASRAIAKAELLLQPRLERAQRNRQVVADWMGQQDSRVHWTLPSGGVTGFPRFPDIDDIEAFCVRLAEEHGVLLVPGSCFGFQGYARLGFGGPTDHLREGLARLAEAVADEHSRRARVFVGGAADLAP